jgi:hypothetical protein
LISTVGSLGPLDFSRFKTIAYKARILGAEIINKQPMKLIGSAAIYLLLFLTPQIFEYNTVWSAELFFPAIAGVCVAALLLMTPGKTCGVALKACRQGKSHTRDYNRR